MDHNHVPLNDWISLAVGAIGFGTALLARKDRLPAWARKWLKRIGPERITDVIERAAIAAMETAKPIDDVRASAAYRKAMVKTLTRRAVEAVSKQMSI